MGQMPRCRCLTGNYKERVVGMAKYWAKHADFYHPVFQIKASRDDIWVLRPSVPHLLMLHGCLATLHVTRALRVLRRASTSSGVSTMHHQV